MVSQRLDVRPILSVLFVALALNSLSGRIAFFFADANADVTGSLFGLSAIIWFALFGMLKIGLDGQRSREMDRYDWIAVWLSVIIMVIPLKILSVLALPALALYIFWRSGSGTPDQRTGILALAITGPAFWGPMTQALLGQEITLLETKLLSLLSSLSTDGNVLHAINGDTLVIAGACSSFANVTLALLLVITLWQMIGLKNDRQLATCIACAVAAVILINSTRLAILGFYPQQFGFWHEGAGRIFFIWGMLAATGLIAIIGVSRAAQRQI